MLSVHKTKNYSRFCIERSHSIKITQNARQNITNVIIKITLPFYYVIYLFTFNINKLGENTTGKFPNIKNDCDFQSAINSQFCI